MLSWNVLIAYVYVIYWVHFIIIAIIFYALQLLVTINSMVLMLLWDNVSNKILPIVIRTLSWYEIYNLLVQIESSCAKCPVNKVASFNSVFLGLQEMFPFQKSSQA